MSKVISILSKVRDTAALTPLSKTRWRSAAFSSVGDLNRQVCGIRVIFSELVFTLWQVKCQQSKNPLFPPPLSQVCVTLCDHAWVVCCCVFPCFISQGQVTVFHILLLAELLLFIEVRKARLFLLSLSISNVFSLSLLFCLCPSSSVNHPVQPNRGFSPIRLESEPMNVTAVPRK